MPCQVRDSLFACRDCVDCRSPRRAGALSLRLSEIVLIRTQTGQTTIAITPTVVWRPPKGMLASLARNGGAILFGAASITCKNTEAVGRMLGPRPGYAYDPNCCLGAHSSGP